MSYQESHMHPGQESPAPNGIGQPSPFILIEDIENYLMKMAEVDSVKKAEDYYNMLRELFITNKSWRDYELGIYNKLQNKKLEAKLERQRMDALRIQPAKQNIVYNMPGGTANLDCDQCNSSNNTYLPGADTNTKAL